MLLQRIVIATLTTAACLLPSASARATFIAVGNEASSTISNLGFISETTEPSGEIDGNPVDGLYTSSGNGFTFSNSATKQSVPSAGWSSWSHPVAEVFVNGSDTTLTIESGTPITAFGFYVQPQGIDNYEINVTVNGLYSLSQSVLGNGGAKYFGFYTVDGDSLNSISISAPASAGGFATGEYSLSSSVVAVPFEFSPALGLVVLGAAGGLSRLKKHLGQQKLKN